MDIVVGSGPAGVACTKALLARKRTVLMLDAGIPLEEEKQKRLKILEQQKPEQWDLSLYETNKITPTFEGVPKKFVYGSDYPYRDVEQDLRIEQHDVYCQQSLALGGLSTVWGAAMLPYRQDDLHEWPFAIDELAPHYKAVLEFVDTTGADDDLSALFPLYDTPQALRQNKQAAFLLSRTKKYEKKLHAAGIYAGVPRLAVRTQKKAGKQGCVYCGKCIFGCPYNLIYNSAQTVEELKKDKNFTYTPDVLVDRVEEQKTGVNVLGRNRTTGKPITFSGTRVFLGCGVISTGRIMLASQQEHDTLEIKDSQTFLIPVMQRRRAGNPRSEQLHTMAQVFIEVADPKLHGTTHMQVYGYSPLYEVAMRSKFGFAYNLLRLPMERSVDRLMVLLGFFHSDVSRGVTMKLRDGAVVLTPNNEHKKRVQKAMKILQRKLWRNSKELGFIPIPTFSRIGEPGKSSHFGSTFPMRKTTTTFNESDLLGRPHGYSRVHLIDASVLPSIPATSITFSVMANAHRIGSKAP